MCQRVALTSQAPARAARGNVARRPVPAFGPRKRRGPARPGRGNAAARRSPGRQTTDEDRREEPRLDARLAGSFGRRAAVVARQPSFSAALLRRNCGRRSAERRSRALPSTAHNGGRMCRLALHEGVAAAALVAQRSSVADTCQSKVETCQSSAWSRRFGAEQSSGCQACG